MIYLRYIIYLTIGDFVRVRLERLFLGLEVQLELKQESMGSPLVRTIELVGFFDLDSQSFWPVSICIFCKLSEGLGESFAHIFRFGFRFGSWFVY